MQFLDNQLQAEAKKSLQSRTGFSGVHFVADAQTLLADTSKGKNELSSSYVESNHHQIRNSRSIERRAMLLKLLHHKTPEIP